ncbi:hypothetical protein TNCV_4734031 [Trichonephila clavipes]|nr:hypothetical protein TNCV_4734031 [Trichonephila clavipes]
MFFEGTPHKMMSSSKPGRPRTKVLRGLFPSGARMLQGRKPGIAGKCVQRVICSRQRIAVLLAHLYFSSKSVFCSKSLTRSSEERSRLLPFRSTQVTGAQAAITFPSWIVLVLSLMSATLTGMTDFERSTTEEAISTPAFEPSGLLDFDILQSVYEIMQRNYFLHSCRVVGESQVGVHSPWSTSGRTEDPEHYIGSSNSDALCQEESAVFQRLLSGMLLADMHIDAFSLSTSEIIEN